MKAPHASRKINATRAGCPFYSWCSVLSQKVSSSSCINFPWRMWRFHTAHVFSLKALLLWRVPPHPPLNSTVDCFQKCAFILWLLDTNAFFFVLQNVFTSPILFACFSPDPLLGSLLTLHHQPPKVYLLSQRCLPWLQLLSESCTVSLGTFKSPFFSLLQGILKTSCQGPPPSIFSVFL